jgi:hypothetical protein
MTTAIKSSMSKKPNVETEVVSDELYNPRKRRAEAQFRVQVDRQIKSSYDTFEKAEAAAIAIKQSHSIVQVSIHNALAGNTTLIEIGTT